MTKGQASSHFGLNKKQHREIITVNDKPVHYCFVLVEIFFGINIRELAVLTLIRTRGMMRSAKLGV